MVPRPILYCTVQYMNEQVVAPEILFFSFFTHHMQYAKGYSTRFVEDMIHHHVVRIPHLRLPWAAYEKSYRATQSTTALFGNLPYEPTYPSSSPSSPHVIPLDLSGIIIIM